MFNPRQGQWWNAPPAQMFEAYYMTLRVHYEMPASEAFATAKRNSEALGIGIAGGVIARIRQALRRPCTCSGAETGCEHADWCPQYEEKP